jgi:3-methyladenine DNA glycosylase/8-oxoguanine DNA glycosylase
MHAWGDLGIRKSAMQLYSLPRLPSQLELEALSDEKGWSPFESVACWYLWKNLDNKS